MKVVKSRAFKGAYIIRENNEVGKKYVDHVFLDDFKYNNDRVEVQYVFYNARYKKWLQDTMYISKEKYQCMRKCANI